jgi:hypothetical protein
VANVGINILNVIGTVKLAWDFAKIMEFRRAVSSGEFFYIFGPSDISGGQG